MSSEGSVSSNGSRIRQFGLYRTIDSRTEEFLRSSRKRQIRQGCACAAISTAITVTVVVSVILVYEYSITSGPNINKKTSLKPNWIALMNDSDITSISSKFNKKINFDITTLKLLPILLKALNKNRYLEKILEDYSSSPPYAGVDATEVTFTRNVFSDSKNWLKLPTTRHYSTDYKTSPLMQWKTPTQRLEYLTKIRKIRDYQRMLNYFDKMINDKVGIYQKRDIEYFTESPLTAGTIPMTKIDRYKNIQRLRKLPSTGKGANDGRVCNCNKLGLLLSKLIGSLQNLIPHIIDYKHGLDIPCKKKTKHIDGFQQLTTARTKRPTKQRISDIFSTIAPSTAKVIENRPKVTLKSRKCCSTSTISMDTISKSTSTATKTTTSTTARTITSTATVEIRETAKTPTLNELNYDNWKDHIIPIPTKKPQKLPNYQIYEETTTDYDLLTKPTETPNTQTTESVEINRLQEVKINRRTTERIVPVKFITESSTERWLKPYTLDAFLPKVNVPLYKEEDYDQYFTTNNILNKATKEFENIDVHSIEYLKTKTPSAGEDRGLSKRDEKINFEGTIDDVKPMNYHTDTMQHDVDLTSMRKLADMLYLPEDKTTKGWKYTTEPEVSTTSDKKIIYPGKQATSMVTNSVENSVDSTTSTLGTNSAENSIDPTTSIIGTNSVENFVESTTSIIGTNSVENSVDPTTSIIGTNSVENSVNPPKSIMLPSSWKNIQIVDSAPDVKNYLHEAASKYRPNSLIQNEPQIIENIGDDELQEEFIRPTEGSRVPYKYKNSTKQNYTRIETPKETAPWDFMKREEKIINKSSKSMLPALRPIYMEIQRNTEWKPEEHGDYDIYNFNNNVFDLPNIN